MTTKKKSSKSLNSLGISTIISKDGQKEHLWNAKDVISYLERKLKIKFDKWQADYILAKGDTAARIGRQSGKSFSQAMKTAVFAALYKPPRPDLHILITGGVERQAYELFVKFKRIMETIAPNMIKGRPTMEKMELTSGLIVRALPCGRDGAGLRNYACVKLVVDEAHYVHDDVFIALEPMLLTTGGHMDLLSTTRGNKGRFRKAFDKDSEFTNFHKKTRDVMLEREVCESWTQEQREFSLNFLDRKEKEMTKLQFKQEFEAEFLDGLQQFFPAAIIDPLLKLDPENPISGAEYYDGQDCARWGGDQNAFTMFRMLTKTDMRMVNLEVSEKVGIRDTLKLMREREKQWKPRKLYIDSGEGGGGGAIFDLLVDDKQFKRKIIAINNATKPMHYIKSRPKKILKEDLYNNAKRMMECLEVLFLKDNRLRESLLSIQFEWSDSGNFIIFGNDSHIAEAVIRALWAVKAKSLKPCVA